MSAPTVADPPCSMQLTGCDYSWVGLYFITISFYRIVENIELNMGFIETERTQSLRHSISARTDNVPTILWSCFSWLFFEVGLRFRKI